MTRPFVDSMPNLRARDRAGVSLVLFDRLPLSILESAPSRPDAPHSEGPALSEICRSTTLAGCFTTPPAVACDGLNAHAASAVPFNWLFPHS